LLVAGYWLLNFKLEV